MTRHNMKHHRHKRAIQARTGRMVQAATGVGHRDMVVQTKKWMLYGTTSISNATGAFAFGFQDVNIGTAGIAANTYNSLINTAALTYEEYRIRRVTVRAQPGPGFTNDDRIKSSVFARVDVNSQDTAATIPNLNTLIGSEATVNKTFTERSNIKLVDYRPICYSNGGVGASSRPIIPSHLQWYNISERSAHLWRGATVAPVIADPTILPNTKSIVVWVDCEIEFRGRRPDFNTLGSLITVGTLGSPTEFSQRTTERVDHSHSDGTIENASNRIALPIEDDDK
jgi:hypothetical protein